MFRYYTPWKHVFRGENIWYRSGKFVKNLAFLLKTRSHHQSFVSSTKFSLLKLDQTYVFKLNAVRIM